MANSNYYVENDGLFRNVKTYSLISDSITLNNKLSRPKNFLLSNQSLLWSDNTTTPSKLIYTNNQGTDIILGPGGSGAGTVTQINTGSGLTGGPITTTGTISIPNSGVTNSMLVNNSITINTVGITGGGTVPLGGSLTLVGFGSVIPALSKTIYVTKYGNDFTGDGSFANPFASLSKAISLANTLSSSINPISISVGTGIYIENNNAGPLTITATHISIIGDTTNGTIIIPNTPGNNFILVTQTTRVTNMTFQSPTPSAIGISLTLGVLSVFQNVRVIGFLIGVACSGGSTSIYGFNNCIFIANGKGLFVNDTQTVCNSCTISGNTPGSSPLNTGIHVTGSNSSFVMSSGIIGLCSTGILITNNSTVTVSASTFRFNVFDIIQNSGSFFTFSGSIISKTINPFDIDIQISGAGTSADIIGCEFDGDNVAGIPEGICIIVSDGANVVMNSCTIHKYITGIQIGIPSDTSSTYLDTSSVSIRDCTTDVIQNGMASLSFVGSTASSSKFVVNNATNINVAYFDLDNNSSLSIGTLVDANTTLIRTSIATINDPVLSYISSLYSNKSIGFDNSALSDPSSSFVISNDNSNVVSVTKDRTKTSGSRFVSDTATPVGTTTSIRGWDIIKNGGNAELAFKYQNTDLVGQIAVPLHTVMQLDGFNNQIQIPTANTQLIFSSDTNLYRNSANVLKTDSNFIVGTLTPDRVVVTNPITNELQSSIVTITELSYLSGVTSSIQTQINGKVSKSGDIMTGTLQLPAGNATSPSLVFTTSTSTGLSSPIANSLSISTNANERMHISPTGTISINAFTTNGVVHNNASGDLSSSLIVDGDITNSTITNSKLATISSTDIPSNIVVRDGSGNFATNKITIDGSISNPTDAATKAYVDAAVTTGLVAKTPALVVSTIAIASPPTGLIIVDGVLLVDSDRVLLVTQGDQKENGLWLAHAGLWTRPADFANGSTVGQAYVLILSGSTNAGSSWLATTPLAVVGTNPINFALFTLPNTITGANVGVGTGLVFKNKTGVTLNFRSLLSGSHIIATTGVDEITIDTDATSVNTINTIVARDGSGNFSANTITANLTGNASGNVLKIGDTMTGTLQLPAGTTLAPSLVFTGSVTSGLSASLGNLSISTNAIERMKISNGGIISIDSFTVAGIVHNDASGNLSSSLIVNADVDPAAAIVDTKLATISTAGKVSNSATTATSLNTPNTIVARDGAGNFSANIILANLTGSASNNVLKAGDTMTGTLQLPAGSTISPSLTFTSSTDTGLSANSSNLSFTTSNLERVKIDSAGIISINSFAIAGVVHNDSSGNLSSSLIVNADIDAAAAIIDTKLATISTAGKVTNSATTATILNSGNTIVLRDPSGNFAAGTITATLNGTATNFSGSLLGDVTGTQTATVVSFVGGQTAAAVAASVVASNNGTSANVPNTLVKRDGTGSFAAQNITIDAGSSASPSLLFTGSTNTGISAGVSNTLSFDTNAIERMSISTTKIITQLPSCDQAIQSFTVTANGQSVIVLATTSILILLQTANRLNLTITFPSSPTNGQYFTILIGSIFNLTVINNGGGPSIVNEISNFAGVHSATYLYYSVTNTWYLERTAS